MGIESRSTWNSMGFPYRPSPMDGLLGAPWRSFLDRKDGSPYTNTELDGSRPHGQWRHDV